jgi:hypothetical protein
MRNSFHGLWFRSVACLLMVVFVAPSVATIAFAQAPQSASQGGDTCMQGKFDGAAAARANPLWILAGAACGIFGVGAAYLIKPSPPIGSLMGRSSEYALCYTDAYQNKARNGNTAWACGGWATFVLIYVAAGGLETSSDTN